MIVITLRKAEIQNQSFLFTETIDDFYHETFPKKFKTTFEVVDFTVKV